MKVRFQNEAREIVAVRIVVGGVAKPVARIRLQRPEGLAIAFEAAA
jgi:hypothetical protein